MVKRVFIFLDFQKSRIIFGIAVFIFIELFWFFLWFDVYCVVLGKDRRGGGCNVNGFGLELLCYGLWVWFDILEIVGCSKVLGCYILKA